jgi:nicotinamide-nucleotide amidase
MAEHESIEKLAGALVRDLIATGQTVATAESCTGGWIAKAITDIPGSSEVFGYGIVSYSNAAKESMLGVPNETLEQQGAVSEMTVEAMARGALRLSGADFSVAVSGVAGPGGGTREKPVGTVCFAWAVRDGVSALVESGAMRLQGDRELVRERTVVHALQGLRERVGT